MEITEVSASPIAKREKKAKSAFSELHKALDSASAIAHYVEEHYPEFRDRKTVNSFFQAISHRASSVYDELFSSYKSHVVALLQTLLDNTESTKRPQPDRTRTRLIPKQKTSGSGGSSHSISRESATGVLMPPATEFLLRAKAHGVHRAEWCVDVANLPNVPEPILSVREMIQALMNADPYAVFLRSVELASAPEELQRCAEEFIGNDSFVRSVDETSQRVALGRLLSKARSLLQGWIPKSPSQPKDSTDAIDKKEEERAASTEKAPVEEEDIAITATTMLDLCYEIGVRQKKELPQKVVFFCSWLSEHSLVPAEYTEVASLLAAAVESTTEYQARSLELVLSLKAAQDAEALSQALGTLLSDDRTGFRWCTADVASAIVVALRKIPSDHPLHAHAVQWLADAQNKFFQGCGLPHRVVAFLQQHQRAERNRQIKRQREEQHDEEE